MNENGNGSVTKLVYENKGRLNTFENTLESYHKRIHSLEDDVGEIRTSIIGDFNKPGLIDKMDTMNNAIRGVQRMLNEKADGKRWFYRTVIGGLIGLVVSLVLWYTTVVVPTQNQYLSRDPFTAEEIEAMR